MAATRMRPHKHQSKRKKTTKADPVLADLAKRFPGRWGKAHTNGHANGHGRGLPAALGKPRPLDTVADGTSKSATTSTPVGRGQGGKFTPGNKFGRGNPHARRLAGLRQAFIGVVDEAKLKALAEGLYGRAMAGDAAAAKLLLLYTLGRPAEVVNPDTLDLMEWKQLDALPTAVEASRVLIDSVGIEPLSEAAAKLIPQDFDGLVQRIEKGDRDDGDDDEASRQFLTNLESVRRRRAGRKLKER